MTRGAWALVAAALALAAPAHATPADFDARLTEADAVRRSDPRRFDALLATLATERDAATPEQRDRFDFLAAYAQAYSGNFEEAIRLSKRLHESTPALDLRFRSAALVVNSAAGIGDFNTGLQYLDTLLRTAGDVADRRLRHDGIATGALLLNQLGQYQDGERLAQQVLDDRPSPDMRCTAGYLRLESRMALEPAAVRDADVVALADECQRGGNRLAVHFSRLQRARLRVIAGDDAAARRLLADDAEAVDATRYPRLIVEVQSLLAQVALRLGDVQAAAVHAGRAVEAGRGSRFSAPVVEALRVLADVARQRGDSAEALRRMAEFAEAQRGYLDEVKARELAVQLARHQTLQQAQSMELLERQNQLLRLQHDVGEQRQTIFLLALALLAVLLGLVVHWALRVKRLQLSFKRLAETDGLTGLANRAHFTAQCERRLAAANASGRRVAVALFDLDHFKQVNDRHGHPAGDAVLRAVGEAIRGSLRPGMQAGRMGGEEFGLVLDADDVPDALAGVEACREAIASLAVPLGATVLGITASFGMARSLPDRRDFKALLIAADAALYTAKASGRNRVCLAPEAEASQHAPPSPSTPHPITVPQGSLHG